MTASVLIGLLAGIASGLLFFLPLPSFIAGIGWGWRTAALAGATAAILLTSILALRAGAVHLIAFGIPVTFVCWLAFLNRPKPGVASATTAGTSIEWYPVGRIIAWLAFMAGGLAGIAVLAVATDYESYNTAIKSALNDNAIRQLEIVVGKTFSSEDRAAFVELVVRAYPGMLAILWLGLMLSSLWMAGRIVQASGRLKRAWPEISTMEFPAATPLIFVASLAATLVPGLLGVIAGGVASALAFAYLVMGLAVVHCVTRGNTFRAMILIAIYLAIVVLGQFAVVPLTILGVGEPLFRLRDRIGTATPSNGRPNK